MTVKTDAVARPSGSGVGTRALTRRIVFAVLAALLTALVSAPFFADTLTRDGPKIERGIVDYGAWGALDRPIELQGQWLLTWRSAPAPGASGLVEVPGPWKGRKLDGYSPSELGAATYSVTLRNLPPGRYTIHVPRVFGATRVAIDGQIVSSRGGYGLTPQTSRASGRSQESTFDARGGDVRLDIDISNFAHRDNGLTAAPVTGLAEPMARWVTIAWLQNILVVTTLALLAAFGIIVAITRPQERASLYLGLACLTLVPLAALTSHDNLIEVALPQLSLATILGFQILTSTVTLGFAFAYIRELYPRETPRLLYWTLQGMNTVRFAIYLAAWIIGGSLALSQIASISASFRTVSFICLLGIVIAACLRRREGSLIFLLGLGSFVLCLVYNDLTINAGLPQVFGANLMPVGSLLLLFSQLLILARRWSGAITSAEESNAELRQLLDVNVAIASEMQLDALLHRIVAVTSQIIHADRSSLFLHDPRTDELWSLVAEGVINREIRFPATSGLAGDAFTHNQLVNVPDAYADPRFNRAIDLTTGYQTRAVLTVPIVTREGRKLGVMQAFNRLDGAPFDQGDEARLSAFAAQAAVAIENATLFGEVAAERNYNDSILRSMSSGVITLDREANVAKLNVAACRILGVAPEAAGSPETRDTLIANNPWLPDEIGEVAASGRSKSLLDADLKVISGEVISANISIVPLVGEDGPAGLLIIVEDISEGKRLQGAMRRFMTQKVVDQVLGREDELLFGAACPASVLFADIRGFTALSEQLGPRDTVDMLNEIFTDLFEAVSNADGLLDKFIGDGIMAVYGAPLSSGRDAINAVDSAVSMLEMMATINTRWRAKGIPEVRLCVGISSGEVVAGTIGSPKRMDYTVIGDSVNLASRLEALTKDYRVGILVCETTAAAVGDQHPTRELDQVRVRGRVQPTRIFEILRPETAPARAALDAYAQGREALAVRDWSAAVRAFETALSTAPDDGPSALMLRRARILKSDPPPQNWDGVWDSSKDR